MRCLLMTVSIRNFVEYGRTRAATRLMSISTNPSASNPRRGRINSQTSGSTARSLWILGGFWVSLGGELNPLFDSESAGLASLLLHCHTSAGRARRYDRRGLGGVCSGRVPPVSAGPFPHSGSSPGPDHYPFGCPSLLGLYHMAGVGPAQAADGVGRPQSQGFAAAA